MLIGTASNPDQDTGSSSKLRPPTQEFLRLLHLKNGETRGCHCRYYHRRHRRHHQMTTENAIGEQGRHAVDDGVCGEWMLRVVVEESVIVITQSGQAKEERKQTSMALASKSTVQ